MILQSVLEFWRGRSRILHLARGCRLFWINKHPPTIEIRAAAYIAMALCLFGIVTTSLWPFEFRMPTHEVFREALFSPFWQLEPPLAFTLLERATFLLVGLVLTGVAVPKHRYVKLCFACGIAFIVAIELSQLFSEGRHARWNDLLIGCFAYTVGLYAGAHLRKVIEPAKYRLVTLTVAIILVMVVVGLAWRGLSVKDLSVWECDYTIGIGNEIGLERQWVGELKEVSISNSREKIRLFPKTAQSSPTSVAPTSRYVVDPLPATFCNETRKLNEFQVSIQLRRSGETLAGPARILTWSNSIYDQNVMIGEENGKVHFRVKSGSRNFPTSSEITADFPPSTDEFFEIRAMYDDGNMTLAFDEGIVQTGSVTRVKLNNGFTAPRLAILFVLLLIAALLFCDSLKMRTKVP